MQHERIPRATAVAWSGGGAPRPAEARFAWVDRESGERLELAVHGGEEFFRTLEAAGFERLGPAGDATRDAATPPVASAPSSAPVVLRDGAPELAADALASTSTNTFPDDEESAPTDGVRELADWRGRGEGRGRVRRKGA